MSTTYDENYCDIAINGGTVCSFNPDCLTECNVGIRNGKIVALTDNFIYAKESVDARGKIVSPGFIDFHSHVDGKIFSGECMVRQGATTTIGGERHFNGSRMRKIYDNGFIINQGYYVSHSFTLRKAVGLDDPYKNATTEEIKIMGSLAEEFFENGAFGVHFGLEFVPGTSTEEIFALAEIAKKYSKPILIHARKDGKEALNSFGEIINIAKQTGVAVHILHLEYMVGYNGVMSIALDMLQDAIDSGVDITADTGLYSAFPTCIGSSILDGDWTKKYRTGTEFRNLVISSGIDSGKECDEEAFNYLRSNFPNTLVTAFVIDAKPIVEALNKNFVFVSTNAADGPHYEKTGHPESAGTFPRLIRKYVREDNVLSLSDALKKITYLPAQRFGIKNKGNIKLGFDGDLVIFDYDAIMDRAEFINRGDPNGKPEGIDYVLANGKIVVRDGRITEFNSLGKLLNKEV